MAFRPDFLEALTLLSRGIAEMVERGLQPPVLVGGAAVEFYTDSDVWSRDFDLVTPHRNELFEVLRAQGFVTATDPGVLRGGVVHPSLRLGVQVVSGQLMDGRAERDRIFVVDVEGAPLGIISVEDLIADRVGQAYSDEPPRKDMLTQAVRLLDLAESIDESYLDRRICEETLSHATLATLKELKA